MPNTLYIRRHLRSIFFIVSVSAAIGAVVRNSPNYLARYGLIPEYKAGLHCGEVISAEIGDLKRDLIYNGDVLNTTARIQSECNRFNARLLASSVLFEQLVLPPGMVAESLGDVMLKGKSHPVGLVRLWQGAEASPHVSAVSQSG